jgi:Cysteine rich repeat
MVKNIVIIVAALTLASGAAAQDRPARGACAADIKTHCAGVERGQGRLAACVKEHLKDLSQPCQLKVAALAAGSKACVADVKEHCKDVRPGRGRIRECLRSALANLSDACKDAISKAVARRRSL